MTPKPATFEDYLQSPADSGGLRSTPDTDSMPRRSIHER